VSLLLAELGVVDWTDPMEVSTVERGAIPRREALLMGDAKLEDLDLPQVIFSVRPFRDVNAPWGIGQGLLAPELFEEMPQRPCGLGLLPWNLAPKSVRMWGDYPSSYSMVGIATCATRLSRPWQDAR